MTGLAERRAAPKTVRQTMSKSLLACAPEAQTRPHEIESECEARENGPRPECECEYVLPVPRSTGQFVVRLCDYEVRSATLRKSRPAFHCWFHTGTVARGRSMPRHFTPRLDEWREEEVVRAIQDIRKSKQSECEAIRWRCDFRKRI